MHEDLIPKVAGELRAAGVAVDPFTANRLVARILVRGEQEFDQLRREMGHCLDPFHQPMIRSLGTGASITEFAIAGVPFAREYLAHVTALGGLATLIVSAFDAILDHGGRVPELFPRKPQVVPARHNGSKVAVVQELVEVYYRRLDELPQSHQNVRAMLEKVIQRMYYSELRSITGAGISRTTWWRKNVLPFVVMGLPAWLAAPSFPVAVLQRHLMWLGRLGEFFGWLDDCLDYAEDSALGQANRIDVRLRSISEESLARSIADQARRILTQWDRANEGSPIRSIFAVIVWTWIEHTPTRVLA
jgi:hypothetical protein